MKMWKEINDSVTTFFVYIFIKLITKSKNYIHYKIDNVLFLCADEVKDIGEDAKLEFHRWITNPHFADEASAIYRTFDSVVFVPENWSIGLIVKFGKSLIVKESMSSEPHVFFVYMLVFSLPLSTQNEIIMMIDRLSIEYNCDLSVARKMLLKEPV